MPFIQIVDYTTSRFEEGEKLANQYRAALGDRSKARRGPPKFLNVDVVRRE